ncbi:MAG: MEKHLA domain-containing protein, partial [Methyloceanibacter sp.]
RGLRIAKSGRRFWIEDGIVWQLVDRDGALRGQAASFGGWRSA